MLSFLILVGYTICTQQTAEKVATSASGVRYAVEVIPCEQGKLIPKAINDKHQIVGYIEKENSAERAFLRQNGKLKLLPGTNAEAATLNNRGQIVGHVSDRHFDRSQPVLWERGRLRQLRIRPGESGEAEYINDQGAIVGNLWDRNNAPWGFVFRKGRLSRIRVQGGYYLRSANAINNAGTIAGRVGRKRIDLFKPTLRVCLLQNKKIIGFGPPREYSYSAEPKSVNDHEMVVGNISYVEGYAVFTIQNGKYEALSRDDSHSVQALNNRGQYVGWFSAGNVIQDGPFRAILWQNGHKYDLNELIPKESGWVLEYAYGINNHGEIVGTGTYHGQSHAFRLIPR